MRRVFVREVWGDVRSLAIRVQESDYDPVLVFQLMCVLNEAPERERAQAYSYLMSLPKWDVYRWTFLAGRWISLIEERESHVVESASGHSGGHALSHPSMRVGLPKLYYKIRSRTFVPPARPPRTYFRGDMELFIRRASGVHIPLRDSESGWFVGFDVMLEAQLQTEEWTPIKGLMRWIGEDPKDWVDHILPILEDSRAFSVEQLTLSTSYKLLTSSLHRGGAGSRCEKSCVICGEAVDTEMWRWKYKRPAHILCFRERWEEEVRCQADVSRFSPAPDLDEMLRMINEGIQYALECSRRERLCMRR